MFSPPIASSGARSPDKQRPRPVPKHVRHMVELMVQGRPGDEDCIPLSFIEAGALAGIKPDVARRWLDRPEVRRLLRETRASFRASVAAGNELALRKIRDHGKNANASVRAVLALEQIGEADAHRQTRGATSPGLCIVIAGGPSPRPVGPVVDLVAEPAREPPDAA